MALKGTPELRRRLKAIRQTFKPVGKAWADDTVIEARHRVRRRTGKTADTFRVQNASQRKATVVGSSVAVIIDKGTREHTIKPKRGGTLRFQARQGGTIFSKRVHHPRTPAHPFRQAAAEAALRSNPMGAELIKQWNSAAP